ncbi:Transmembrane protein 151B [Camponotus floridanus]|uniref:Transmembrane protein 151B n=1 Tax=Camponotus floridanus TaxID=104421 RepID=E2A2E0_CAMFO|nr:Transmembrane protein 151B [Camponotus floridanus]
MVNYSKYPIRSTKHISSPCDDGYIYIPVAFMGMLYLVYLVECYHSPIRIDLLHAESQDSVLSKLTQLKMAQPRIWWKAVSYHYVRRKRQITRYRNGDNYTTTQVYYERVNTHSATSHYYYDYCGVKDISKELILEPKIPITKIMLTKGFAFSNIRSATEFEEARSRFFAEQELSDDYMEMREGLDLGYNVNTMLVAVLGNPWFTNRYIYWCLSALLLSWPLRVIIEYKTQYADYQVTKLFGVNYDTPTSGEPIHASMSQLSQPGSYMLAPSYSEALLMDPATPRNDGPERNQENWQAQRREADVATDMVPSYSEALLYERAEHDHRNAIAATTVAANVVPSDVTHPPCNANDPTIQALSPMPCECHCPCPCHGNANDYERSYVEIAASSELPPGVPGVPGVPATSIASDTFESEIATLRTTADGRLHPPGNVMPHSMDNLQAGASPSKCGSCGRISTSTQTINTDVPPRVVARNKSVASSQTFTSSADLIGPMPRDISEPNLRSRAEPAVAFPNGNVRSLENILENEEELMGGGRAGFNVPERTLPIERLHFPERIHRRLPPSLAHHRSFSLDEPSVSPRNVSSNGTIPKLEPRSRIMVNPMSNEACWKLPDSRTYFCLKSILKQNRRRYTLVTADEFQNLADQELINQGIECVQSPVGRSEKGPRSRERLNPRRRMPSFEEFMPRDKMYSVYDQKRESTRTLIFASPLQEVFPGDPFGGKNIVPIGNSMEYTGREDSARPSRSPAIRDPPGRCVADAYIGERTGRVPVEPFRADAVAYPPRIAHPSYRHERDLRFLLQTRSPSTTMDANVDVRVRVDETPPLPPPRAYRNDAALPPPYGGLPSERAKRWSTSSNEYDDMRSYEGRPADFYTPDRRHQLNQHRPNRPGLRPGSFRERRPKLVHTDRNFRRSFTGRVEDYRAENDLRRANFSMETSL